MKLIKNSLALFVILSFVALTGCRVRSSAYQVQVGGILKSEAGQVVENQDFRICLNVSYIVDQKPGKTSLCTPLISSDGSGKFNSTMAWHLSHTQFFTDKSEVVFKITDYAFFVRDSDAQIKITNGATPQAIADGQAQKIELEVLAQKVDLRVASECRKIELVSSTNDRAELVEDFVKLHHSMLKAKHIAVLIDKVSMDSQKGEILAFFFSSESTRISTQEAAMLTSYISQQSTKQELQQLYLKNSGR